jgi:hypothetical protein
MISVKINGRPGGHYPLYQSNLEVLYLGPLDLDAGQPVLAVLQPANTITKNTRSSLAFIAWSCFGAPKLIFDPDKKECFR